MYELSGFHCFNLANYEFIDEVAKNKIETGEDSSTERRSRLEQDDIL